MTNLAERERPVSAWFMLHEGRIAEIEDPEIHVPDDGRMVEKLSKKIHGKGSLFGWLLPLPLPTPTQQRDRRGR